MSWLAWNRILVKVLWRIIWLMWIDWKPNDRSLLRKVIFFRRIRSVHIVRKHWRNCWNFKVLQVGNFLLKMDSYSVSFQKVKVFSFDKTSPEVHFLNKIIWRGSWIEVRSRSNIFDTGAKEQGFEHILKLAVRLFRTWENEIKTRKDNKNEIWWRWMCAGFKWIIWC